MILGGRPLRAALLILLAVNADTKPLLAQGWTTELYAGRAQYETAPTDVGATSAILSLRYNQWYRWFYLTAGVPLDSGDPYWGGFGAGDRLARPLAWGSVGIDLSASGHVQRDPIARVNGGGGAVEVLPLVAARTGPFLAEFRTGWMGYSARLDTVRWSQSVHATETRLSFTPTGALELGVEGRYWRADGDGFPFAGGSVRGSLGRAAVWGSIGAWFHDLLPTTNWGTGVAFSLDWRTQLWASVQRESGDPLYWGIPRTSWGVGVSRQLGGRRSAATPIAAVVDGMALIRLPAEEISGTPSIAGDFTGWEPVPMEREGDQWVHRVVLPAGVYRYAFRSEQGEWFVPESESTRIDDGMGGYNAVLVIQ